MNNEILPLPLCAIRHWSAFYLNWLVLVEGWYANVLERLPRWMSWLIAGRWAVEETLPVCDWGVCLTLNTMLVHWWVAGSKTYAHVCFLRPHWVRKFHLHQQCFLPAPLACCLGVCTTAIVTPPCLVFLRGTSLCSPSSPLVVAWPCGKPQIHPTTMPIWFLFIRWEKIVVFYHPTYQLGLRLYRVYPLHNPIGCSMPYRQGRWMADYLWCLILSLQPSLTWYNPHCHNRWDDDCFIQPSYFILSWNSF